MNGKSLNTGLGVGMTALFESQVFPFMLSSAFTARTVVKEKDQVAEVKTDVWIAVGISVMFSAGMAFLLSDWITFLFGTLFAFVLLGVYEIRGELI